VVALLTLAFAMKAAAWPVNAWLPASYHTPPPALSALMAGLLTKVGVYALLRTLAFLFPASAMLLEPVLVAVAAATLLLGPLGAIAETNLRRALGFLVIGGIGASVAGIALGGETGLAGAASYIVHAMLTITALYMLAGLIEAATGETDTRRMGGLYAKAPLLTFGFFAMLLAVSGVPPFLGFWPKLLLVEAGFNAWANDGDPGGLVLWLGVLANALLTLIAATRLFAHAFWRAGPEGPEAELPNPALKPLDEPHWRPGLAAGFAMTVLVLALGLYPEPLMAFGKAAAAALLDPSAYIAATGLAEVTP
jgi:multicomponent Na+:H+ antiporter subunit D